VEDNTALQPMGIGLWPFYQPSAMYGVHQYLVHFVEASVICWEVAVSIMNIVYTVYNQHLMTENSEIFVKVFFIADAVSSVLSTLSVILIVGTIIAYTSCEYNKNARWFSKKFRQFNLVISGIELLWAIVQLCIDFNLLPSQRTIVNLISDISVLMSAIGNLHYFMFIMLL